MSHQVITTRKEVSADFTTKRLDVDMDSIHVSRQLITTRKKVSTDFTTKSLDVDMNSIHMSHQFVTTSKDLPTSTDSTRESLVVYSWDVQMGWLVVEGPTSLLRRQPVSPGMDSVSMPGQVVTTGKVLPADFTDECHATESKFPSVMRSKRAGGLYRRP